MKLTMLGTGNALVTECYNTCFVISDCNKHFLVDGGGGIRLLKQLKDAELDWRDIRDIFVTHKHLDHLTGILWMIRLLTQVMSQGVFEGDARIYAHEEVIDILRQMTISLLSSKQSSCLDHQLHLIALNDGDQKEIIGHKVTFFDIQSTKAKQYGFSMELSQGRKLTCCGDEPYRDCELPYLEGSTWLLHEAFCLYAQRDIFQPYVKSHSTVKEACETAEFLKIPNLLLYHTEEQNLSRRKQLYTDEGRQFYHGNLFVPDDLEVIEL